MIIGRVIGLAGSTLAAAGAITAHTLPNGLKVALAPLPHLHSVSVVAAVRVGSRYETRETNGLSHLCEHMLFRGTPSHPSAHAFNLALESLGGTLDASTHTDFTAYRIRLPPATVDTALKVLAEIFDRPLFLGLDVEKNVVREEILESLDEDGQDVDPDDLIHRAVFGDHPLGHKLAGPVENIERFTLDDLRGWHALHHGARNVVVAIAGPFDPSAMLASVTSAFGALSPGERIVPPPFVAPTPGPRLYYVDSAGSQTELRFAVPTVGEQHAHSAPLELLSRVLDDGLSARLFRSIVEDRGLAYEAFGGLDQFEDTGLLMVGAACAQKSVLEVADALLALLAGLRDTAVTPAELERARTRTLFELDALIDDPSMVAEFAATNLLFEHGETLASLRARTERVTLKSMEEAARSTLVPAHLQAVAVGSLTEEEEQELDALVARSLK